MSKINNAADRLLNVSAGAIPNVIGALYSYFQPMTFVPIQKTVSGFQLVESARPIELMGVIQPFTPRQLALKPEGERAWTWWKLNCEPSVILQVDSCIQYLGQQYRVASRKDFRIYGYIEFDLVQDWTGSGP